MNIVPRVSTPQSLAAIADALVNAYVVQFGREPDQTTAELLTAQIMVETASGQAIKNHSPGNISASARWTGDAWRPPWFDEPTETTSARDRALHAAMLEGKAPSAFRAFRTLEDGMADYVHTLARQFPIILAARTPSELAQAIFDSGYTRDHTPSETSPTLHALVGRVREAGLFDALPKAQLPAPASPGSSSPAAPRGYSFVPVPAIARGSSGPLVVLWQRAIAPVSLAHDGLFGPLTEQATKNWQSARMLGATGRVGSVEWALATGDEQGQES